MSADLHDGDRWVTCRCGQRHWGAHGAAGLLLWRVDAASGQVRVLLQHRSPRSHHGDTWGIPGGALCSGEDAITGALREAEEEACIDARGVQVWATSTLQHPDWQYTTVIGQDHWQMQARVGDWESVALQWVALDDIDQLPLLPAFATAFNTLTDFLRPLQLLAPRSISQQLTGRFLAGAPLGLPLSTVRPEYVTRGALRADAFVLATDSMAHMAPANAQLVAENALRPVGN